MKYEMQTKATKKHSELRLRVCLLNLLFDIIMCKCSDGKCQESRMNRKGKKRRQWISSQTTIPQLNL